MISLSEIQGNVKPCGHGGMQTVEEKPKVHFKYDHEWLKKVLKDECPDCEATITKNGTLRRCTNCDLKIYGNPVLVAYHKLTPINPYYLISKTHCPYCNYDKFEDDYKHAETVCLKCGSVLSGPYDIRVKYPWHENYFGSEPKNQYKFFMQKE